MVFAIIGCTIFHGLVVDARKICLRVTGWCTCALPWLVAWWWLHPPTRAIVGLCTLLRVLGRAMPVVAMMEGRVSLPCLLPFVRTQCFTVTTTRGFRNVERSWTCYKGCTLFSCREHAMLQARWVQIEYMMNTEEVDASTYLAYRALEL